MIIRFLFALLVLLALNKAQAQPSAQALEGTSGLKVPRFVSLGASEANMRSGPGETYPVAWVYRRQGLPMEVIAEYGIWRQVRDHQGVKGWMNKNLLSGARTLLVVGSVRTVYARADLQSRPLFRAEPGVIARIDICEADWCRIEVEGRTGFLPRGHGWGTYAGEAVD